MAARLPAQVGARAGSDIATSRLPLRVMAARAARTACSLGRQLAGTVEAALDALLIGLVGAFVVTAGLNGPAMYLGIPWPLEMLVSATGALGAVLIGAAIGVAAAKLVHLVGRGISAALSRTPVVRRAPARLRRAAGLPVRVVDGLPAAWLGAFGGALALVLGGPKIGLLGLFMPANAMAPYIFITGVVFALTGAATHLVRPVLARPVLARPGRVRRVAAALLASTAVLVTGGGTAVLLSPGSTAALVAPDPRLDGVATPSTLADPGLPGAYAIRELSYGSGTDRNLQAFGRDALLTTPTVDASGVLPALGAGADEARAWFWGFGSNALPLNGLAWLPVGAGPFPLVLIVHGNHAMGDFSEAGYEYLGRHLASRGFIAVSIDEDFLNGSWADDWDGAEQIVRAWLLLLHLDTWRTWNADLSSPFHGLVDMTRVALAGHSRGGEAASVAASLIGRSTAPKSGMDPWPTGLPVRAVVSIAPSDGQYATPVVLRDVDFLLLQGGHDADARSWLGLGQYSRTLVAADDFKAAFWTYRANHGQFNTTWGRSDHGPSGGAQLNLAPLLDPAAQEDVAKTVIGAFLEASLNETAGYRGLFQRPMTGREWLPDDIFLVRSVDGRLDPLTLADPSHPSPGVTVTTTGFESTRSVLMPLRAFKPGQGVRGTELRWAAIGGEASWGLDGLESRVANVTDPVLHVSLANGDEPATGAGVLDPLVELTTSDGVSVAIQLSRWGALPPPLPTQLSKSPIIDALGGLDLSLTQPVERVLQSYAIPFADFAAENPAFRPDRVASVRLIVDRSTAGALWMAEVGLAGA